MEGNFGFMETQDAFWGLLDPKLQFCNKNAFRKNDDHAQIFLFFIVVQAAWYVQCICVLEDLG